MKKTQYYDLAKFDYKKDSTIDFVTGVAGVGNSSNMDKIDTVLKELSDNKSNVGHIHKKSEVGLDLVENYPIASSDEALDGVATDRYMTPALVQEVINYGNHLPPQDQKVAELRKVVKSVYTTTDNQKEIAIPMQDFDEEIHLFELRVGGVPFFHERYSVLNEKVVLNSNEIGLPSGKRVDFVFYYLEQVGENRLPIHGKNIFDGSVTRRKISKDLLNIIDGAATRDELNSVQSDLSTIQTDLEGKADLLHTHDDYALVGHTHGDYALSNHNHDNYATAQHSHSNYSETNHTHSEYSEVGHSHSDYSLASHTHDNYAEKTHAHTHGVGGSDMIVVEEAMLSDELRRKINIPTADIEFPDLTEVKKSVSELEKSNEELANRLVDVDSNAQTNKDNIDNLRVDLSDVKDTIIPSLQAEVNDKADMAHTHSEYLPKTEHQSAINSINQSINGKANAVHSHPEYLPKPSAGQVSEMGQVIHFHKAGSTTSFDSKIYVDGASKLRIVSGGHDYDINGEITNLKSSVSNGKRAVANAITAKGVSANMEDTFDSLATKIGQIETESETTFEKVHELAIMEAGTKGVYVTPKFQYSGTCFEYKSDKTGVTITRDGTYRFVTTFFGGVRNPETSVKVYKNGSIVETVEINQPEGVGGYISSRIRCVKGDVLSIQYAPLASFTVYTCANYCFLARTIE